MPYEFNLNSVKCQNLPDPIGFNMVYIDQSESRAKISDVNKVKANVSL